MSFFRKPIFLALVAIIFAILALVAIIFVVPQTADVENTTKKPISFRGIPIDGTNVKNQVTKLCEDYNSGLEYYDRNDCNPIDNTRYMFFKTEFGNVNGRITVKFTENWAIDNIYTGGTKSQMMELAGILAGKYGKPARDNNVLQNNAGAKFNQIIYSWKDARGNTMTVYSILDRVDEGALFIRSAEGEAASEKDWEMEKQRSKSKL